MQGVNRAVVIVKIQPLFTKKYIQMIFINIFGNIIAYVYLRIVVISRRNCYRGRHFHM